MKNIEYKISTAKQNAILCHLLSCNKDFRPFLEESVNLNKFSIKIVNYAITFEAWYKKELIGLMSVYFNDLEQRAGFINHLSVLDDYKEEGISNILFSQCLNYGIEKNFRYIMLEVEKDNKIAINLYNKFGFIAKANKSNKIIMKKELGAKIG